MISQDLSGQLRDEEGNIYEGTVDSNGVHLWSERTGTVTVMWKENSNPVEFTQQLGDLAGITFTFPGQNPHTGQDTRGTFTYTMSYQDAQKAPEDAGFKRLHGLQPGIDSKSKDKTNRDNVAHVGLQESGQGTFHTGESRGLAHVPQALADFGEWLGDKLAGR